MPNLAINRFNGGEFTPKLDARADIESYSGGCRKLENFLPEVYGDVQRRPGTKFIYDATTPPS